MSPAIPFRRRSSLPSLLIVLGAVAAAVIGFAVTMTFLNWQSRPGVEQTRVEILRPTPAQSGQIEVIDGDTVRFKGVAYRLVGIDTPERGDKAPCDVNDDRAEAATTRLRALIGRGDARLIRVACSCRPGQEGTRNCNSGRLCGSLLIGGRDVGTILISEGLAFALCELENLPVLAFRPRPWALLPR